MLTIIRGLPGSGKSTFAKKAFPGVFHVEQDMFFIHNGKYHYDKDNIAFAVAWCKDTVFKALDAGFDVVVSNTFIHKWMFAPFIEFCHEYQIPYQVIRMNNKFKDIHNLPESVLKDMTDRFEDFPGELIQTSLELPKEINYKKELENEKVFSIAINSPCIS